jgi:hypothetical protein
VRTTRTTSFARFGQAQAMSALSSRDRSKRRMSRLNRCCTYSSVGCVKGGRRLEMGAEAIQVRLRLGQVWKLVSWSQGSYYWGSVPLFRPNASQTVAGLLPLPNSRPQAWFCLPDCSLRLVFWSHHCPGPKPSRRSTANKTSRRGRETASNEATEPGLLRPK